MTTIPKVQAPFQIEQEDIERSSLEPQDEGKWALIVCGCYHLFETRLEAQQCRQRINE